MINQGGSLKLTLIVFVMGWICSLQAAQDLVPPDMGGTNRWKIITTANWFDKVRVIQVSYKLWITSQEFEPEFQIRNVAIDFATGHYILQILSYKDSEFKKLRHLTVVTWDGWTNTTWTGYPKLEIPAGVFPSMSQVSPGSAIITSSAGDGDPLGLAFTAIGKASSMMSKTFLAGISGSSFSVQSSEFKIDNKVFIASIGSEGLPRKIDLLGFGKEDAPKVIRSISYSDYKSRTDDEMAFPWTIDVKRFTLNGGKPRSAYSIQLLSTPEFAFDVEAKIKTFQPPVGCRIQDNVKNIEFIKSAISSKTIDALGEQLDRILQKAKETE